MKKTLNAIFLLSGTAIGSGMLSLPIVLAKIGVVPIIFIMLLFCALTYFSALVRVELNLQSDKDNTLGKVGLIFSGPKVAWMGDVSLKILMFSLLAAYLYGLSSIIKSIFLENIALTNVVVAVSALLFLLMVSSPQILLNLNKWTIVALITMVTAVVAMMASHFKLESVVWFTRKATNFGTLTAILPIIFTSFGFQGSIHSLTKMCNNDIKLIKTACLWGSIIPATVYIIWTGSVICLLSAKFPDSLATLMSGGIEVSELVTMLTMTCNWKFVKTLLLAVSLTAITTSIFGVGLCLKDDFNTFFKKSLGMRSSVAASCFCAIVPSCLVAIFVPNAFIKVLSFAGMLLVAIAIFIPIALLGNIRQAFRLKALNSKFVISALLVSGIVITLCEIYNLVS